MSQFQSTQRPASKPLAWSSATFDDTDDAPPQDLLQQIDTCWPIIPSQQQQQENQQQHQQQQQQQQQRHQQQQPLTHPTEILVTPRPTMPDTPSAFVPPRAESAPAPPKANRRRRLELVINSWNKKYPANNISNRTIENTLSGAMDPPATSTSQQQQQCSTVVPQALPNNPTSAIEWTQRKMNFLSTAHRMVDVDPSIITPTNELLDHYYITVLNLRNNSLEARQMLIGIVSTYGQITDMSIVPDFGGTSYRAFIGFRNPRHALAAALLMPEELAGRKVFTFLARSKYGNWDINTLYMS